MVSEYVSCPLCGFEFSRADTLCGHGCPLGSMCHLICCPSCGYEFPERPTGGSWLKKVFGREEEKVTSLPEGVVAASTLAAGDRATLVCMGLSTGTRERSLTVYGLVPGAEVEIVQQSPACVIRIDQTELALDREIADEILVEPEIAGSSGP